MTPPPTAQLTAVTRTVTPAKNGSTVGLSQTFDVAPEQLWEALTTAERLARWFGTARGDVVPGGRSELAERETGGRRLEGEPPRRLLLTWEFGKSSSELELLISPAEHGEGTTLTLRHTVPADAHWATFGPGATGCGWDAALYALAHHLEDPGADLMRRLGSSAAPHGGGAFPRATAEAWYEAHVAGGADRKPARKASLRTAAAYLGEEIETE